MKNTMPGASTWSLSARHGLALAERLATRLEHGLVAPIRPARQHHVHERGVHHLPALGVEPVGVVLDAEAPAATPVALQHDAEVLSRVRALAVTPEADVLDDGGDAGLAQVGRARAERELPVGAQVHALEHALAARVVAGEVVHALLPEDEQAVESSLGHRPAGPAPSCRQLLLREGQCHGVSDQVLRVTSPRPRRKALAPSTTVVTPIRNELTAAMVGSTSRTRLFQKRTVNVWTSTPDRKSVDKRSWRLPHPGGRD